MSFYDNNAGFDDCHSRDLSVLSRTDLEFAFVLVEHSKSFSIVSKEHFFSLALQ